MVCSEETESHQSKALEFSARENRLWGNFVKILLEIGTAVTVTLSKCCVHALHCFWLALTFFLTFWDLWFDFFLHWRAKFLPIYVAILLNSRILQNKDLSLLLAYGFYLSPFRQSFVVDRLDQKGVINVVQLADLENIVIRLAIDVQCVFFNCSSQFSVPK